MEVDVDMLQGAIFAKATLPGINLSMINLEGANFEEADLTKIIFQDANLAGANFSGAKMHDADLDGSTLKKCTWTGAFTQGMTMGVSSETHEGCTFDVYGIPKRMLSTREREEQSVYGWQSKVSAGLYIVSASMHTHQT